MRGASAIIVRSTAKEILVTDPSYASVAWVFLCIAAVTLVIGYLFLVRTRSTLMLPLPVFFWCVPTLLAVPFGLIGLKMAATTTVLRANAESGTLSLQKSFAMIPFSAHEYPLGQITSVRVGVGHVCRYLYMDMADGSSPKLLGCTDRSGYAAAAEAMNRFLAKHRDDLPKDELLPPLPVR